MAIHHFGVAPAGKQAADAISGLPTRNIFADSNNFTRCFQAQDLRGAGRRRIMPAALQQIRAIHRRRMNLDENVIAIILRGRAFCQIQAAVFIIFDMYG